MANVYYRTNRTGGTSSDLDGADGSALNNGDLAFVVNTSEFKTYYLDADSAADENDPYVIAPDANTGDKRWILTEITKGYTIAGYYGGLIQALKALGGTKAEIWVTQDNVIDEDLSGSYTLSGITVVVKPGVTVIHDSVTQTIDWNYTVADGGQVEIDENITRTGIWRSEGNTSGVDPIVLVDGDETITDNTTSAPVFYNRDGGIIIGGDPDSSARIASARDVAEEGISVQARTNNKDVPGTVEIFPGGNEGRSHFIATNSNDTNNWHGVEFEVNGQDSWFRSITKGSPTTGEITKFLFYNFPAGIFFRDSPILMGDATRRAFGPSNIYTNVNTDSQGISVCHLEGQWNNNSIAQIEFLTGADTTNKDDGDISIKTYDSGSGGPELYLSHTGKADFTDFTNGVSLGDAPLLMGGATRRFVRESVIWANNNPSDTDNTLFLIDGQWNQNTVAQITVKSGKDTTNKDGGDIEFKTQSGGTTSGLMRLQEEGHLIVGSSVNSVQSGDGIVNAKEFYDDGSQLTDYVFDKYLETEPSFEYTEEVKNKKAALDPSYFDPDKFAEYWRKNHHLPGMPDVSEIINGRVKLSLGELNQRLMEIVELQAIHIEKLNSRLKKIEEILEINF